MTPPQQDAGPQNEGDFPGTILFRRDEWVDFRDPNRISNTAGVRFEELPKLVVKELCDRALDAAGSGEVEVGLLGASAGEVTLFVADRGPGQDGANEEVAERYSVRRQLVGSKTLRLPTRGMLGNGLRVVAGVVLVSGGRVRVSTRGRTLTLEPQDDGRTVVTGDEPWEGVGARVEVTLRGELARHAASGGRFQWADVAKRLNQGTHYKGRSSPYWYDPAGSWELLRAAGDVRVAHFIERAMDGCADKARAQAIAGTWPTGLVVQSAGMRPWPCYAAPAGSGWRGRET